MLSPIVDTEKLIKACEIFSKSEAVMVDVEFARSSTYYPQLCLIQVANKSFVTIIDTLSLSINLEPFWDLMRKESVLKVFHSGRQDIEVIFHHGDVIPKPVFDTQVAAMMCGMGDDISYNRLVKLISGKNIDKSARRTDWSARPLSEAQLDYARSDVIHLAEAYEFLSRRLQDNSRRPWVEEEMEVLTSKSTYDKTPENAWLRLNLDHITSELELKIIKELATWREIAAQKRNVPRPWVLKDPSILDIAKNAKNKSLTTVEDECLQKKILSKNDSKIVFEIVKHVLTQQKSQKHKNLAPPQHKPHTAVILLMKLLLKAVSELYGVDEQIIASTNDLKAIAKNDSANVAAMRGWRKSIFGDRALELKQGKLALSLENEKLVITQTRAPGAPRIHGFVT